MFPICWTSVEFDHFAPLLLMLKAKAGLWAEWLCSGRFCLPLPSRTGFGSILRTRPRTAEPVKRLNLVIGQAEATPLSTGFFPVLWAEALKPEAEKILSASNLLPPPAPGRVLFSVAPSWWRRERSKPNPRRSRWSPRRPPRSRRSARQRRDRPRTTPASPRSPPRLSSTTCTPSPSLFPPPPRSTLTNSVRRFFYLHPFRFVVWFEVFRLAVNDLEVIWCLYFWLGREIVAEFFFFFFDNGVDDHVDVMYLSHYLNHWKQITMYANSGCSGWMIIITTKIFQLPCIVIFWKIAMEN